MSTTKIAPKVGQKVYPLPDDNGSWLGIPAEYQNAIGIVTEVGTIGSELTVSAEFQSHQKPDDSLRWAFRNWKPAYEAGDTVRIVGFHGDMQGRIGTIVRIDESSIPLLVQGVSPSMPGESYWFGLDQVEAVVDGETLTVSVSSSEEQVGADNITIPANATPDELRAIIERCSNDLAEAKRLAETRRTSALDWQQRADDWEHDFNHLAEVYLDEAVERDWCEEYERVNDEKVTPSLRRGSMPLRDEEVDVSYRERVEVEVERHTTVRLPRGWDSDDLQRAAREVSSDGGNDPTRQDIISALRDEEASFSCEGFVDDSAESV
jgi:hypothetical protein